MTSLPRSLLKAVLELPSASSSSRFPSPVLFRSTHLTFPSTCFSLPPQPNRVNARFFSSPSPLFAPSPSPEPRPTAGSSRLDVTSPASAPSTRALTTTSSTLPTTPPPPLEPPGTPIDHPTPLLADWPRRSASKQLSVVASVRSFFDLNRFDTAKRTEEEEVQESKGSYKRLLTLAIPEKKPLLLGLFVRVRPTAPSWHRASCPRPTSDGLTKSLLVAVFIDRKHHRKPPSIRHWPDDGLLRSGCDPRGPC